MPSTSSYWGFSLSGDIAVSDLKVADDGSVVVSGIERYPQQSKGRNFVAKYADDGTQLWHYYLGDTPQSSSFNSGKILLDESGNIFYANTFDGDIDLDGLSLQSFYDDALVLKIGPDGALELVKHISGGLADSISAAELLDDGSLIIAGVSDWRALGKTSEDGSWGGGFLSQIAPDGNTEWLKPLNTSSSTIASIKKVSDGVLLAGSFRGEIILDEQSLQSAGNNSDLLTFLINENKQVEWAVSAGGSRGYDTAHHLIEIDQGFLVAGYYYDNASFGEIDLSSGESGYSGFVALQSHDGAYQWATSLPSGWSGTPSSIQQSENGDIVVASSSGLVVLSGDGEIQRVIEGVSIGQLAIDGDHFVYTGSRPKYLEDFALWRDSEPSSNIVAAFSQEFEWLPAATSSQPSDLQLDNLVFPENIAAGTVLATMSSLDLDPDDAHEYFLDPDSEHASHFSISGDQLIINHSPDFESLPYYSIAIAVHDQQGNVFPKDFQLEVLDVPEIVVNEGDSIELTLQADPNASGLGYYRALVLSADGSYETPWHLSRDYAWNADTSNSYRLQPGAIRTTQFEAIQDFFREGDESLNLYFLASGEEVDEFAVPAYSITIKDATEPANIHFETIAGVPLPMGDGFESYSLANLPGSNELVAEDAVAFVADQVYLKENIVDRWQYDDGLSIHYDQLSFELIKSGREGSVSLIEFDDIGSYFNSNKYVYSLEAMHVDDQGSFLLASSKRDLDHNYEGSFVFRYNVNGGLDDVIEISGIGTIESIATDESGIYIHGSAVGNGGGKDVLRKYSGDFEEELWSVHPFRGVLEGSGGLYAGHRSLVLLDDGTLLIAENGYPLLGSEIYADTGKYHPTAAMARIDSSDGALVSYELIEAGWGYGNIELYAVGENIFYRSSNGVYSVDPQAKPINHDFYGFLSDPEAPSEIVLSDLSFDEGVAAASVVATLFSKDSNSADTHAYELVDDSVYPDHDHFSIIENRLIIDSVPDYEFQDSYSIRLRSTDSSGLSLERSFSLSVNDVRERLVSVPHDVAVQQGHFFELPVVIDDAADLYSFDFTLSVDPALIESTEQPLAVATSLTADWTLSATMQSTGLIHVAGSSATPLTAGAGPLALLNLRVDRSAPTVETSLLLDSVRLNGGELIVDAEDGLFTIEPATSFQVLDVRQMPNGLALGLPEAPDMEAFNLYDGPEDAAFDQADLTLTNGAGDDIALSAHWQDASRELLLLAAEALAPGEYTLTIDSRSDGLISASSGELLDGNGDGTAGDAYSFSFTKSEAEHSLSIGDTARGAGQALSLNGLGSHDPLTGEPAAGGAGLPIHFSTSAAVRSLSGSVSFDSALFVADGLTVGADLPDDWSLSVDSSSPAGQLLYTASGSTAIRGRDQEIVRFQATVAAAAAPPERGTAGNGVYGSTALINASLSSDQLTGETISVDPGLVALAYAGDSTGNGSLSSLDASRVQRVVVGLDTGFEAYDDINPVLVGDTTGNGGLSSLDASRIQQQVVGLPVDSFPMVA